LDWIGLDHSDHSHVAILCYIITDCTGYRRYYYYYLRTRQQNSDMDAACVCVY